MSVKMRSEKNRNHELAKRKKLPRFTSCSRLAEHTAHETWITYRIDGIGGSTFVLNR